MAQTISLLGATYPDVPAVVLPKDGGGTASFTDVTDTTAAAADVASGKYFYTAAGVRTEGTSSGGGGDTNPVADEKDVNFIDYDGTIRYSYSAAEFANLTELPANPTHQGLTAQGWNWTLADAKEYVSVYGMHEIGQSYITYDGATRIFICLYGIALSPVMYIAINGTVTIDWGDGTSEIATGSSVTTFQLIPHVYAQSGRYIVAVSGSGKIAFKEGIFRSITNTANTNKYYLAITEHIQAGSNLYSSGVTIDYLFSNNTGLKTISIPKNIYIIGTRMFYGCKNLRTVVVPSDTFSTLTSSSYFGAYCFAGCTALNRVSFPRDITRFNSNMFDSCVNLRKICLSDLATNASYYGYIFKDSGVQIICGRNVIWTEGCSGCSSLVKFSINNQYTSSQVTNNTFYHCDSLPELTITNASQFVGSSMSYLYSLESLTFLLTTPGTVQVSGCFTGLPTTCKIYIPYSALAAYLTRTNYPSSAAYTYIGFGTYESGETLPTQDATAAYNVTWYATKADAIAGTNPITQGNGNEIYCTYVAV